MDRRRGVKGRAGIDNHTQALYFIPRAQEAFGSMANDTYEICWDWSPGGNVAHVAEHGVTPEEVEQVLAACLEHRVADRTEPDRWNVFGFTEARRFLKVVFELEWVVDWNCWAVFPITAFEPD